jgi:hypothetical protein
MLRRKFLVGGAAVAVLGAFGSVPGELFASPVGKRNRNSCSDPDNLIGCEADGPNPVALASPRSTHRINIADFGAVSGEDCSAAIQRAIDYVESLGGNDVRDSGGTIEFGAGVWYASRLNIRKFGVRFVGAGRRATIIANRSKTEPLLLISQGDRSVTPIVGDIDFENLQFRNTVDRDDDAGFLIRGILAESLLFSSVDFISSPLAPSQNKSPLRCNFIQAATFQSRWSNCNFWGILGCAIEIPDGFQSDTILFDGCVWAYCSVAGVFGLGKASGNNGMYFVSCKVIGNQGGGYVSSSSDNFALTSTLGVSSEREIQVKDSRNFAVNQAVIIGLDPARAQVAFVRGISGNVIKLDRKVTAGVGDTVVQGRVGFLFGHVSMPRVQSSQFEGCDVGIYLIGGKRLTVDSTAMISCARGILINFDFDYLKIGNCIGATMGQMKNRVAWRFLSISNMASGKNIIEMTGTSVDGSGYARPKEGGFVVNETKYPVRLLQDNREVSLNQVANPAE